MFGLQHLPLRVSYTLITLTWCIHSHNGGTVTTSDVEAGCVFPHFFLIINHFC
jgi:hypothetical protein